MFNWLKNLIFRIRVRFSFHNSRHLERYDIETFLKFNIVIGWDEETNRFWAINKTIGEKVENPDFNALMNFVYNYWIYED